MKIFLYSSSVYPCHLLISSVSVRSIPFLSFTEAHLCMKCSLGVSNFLEEISRLSHAIVFLYFFALITEEGFLISPCYSLELCIQLGISFLFSFAFYFFSQLFVRPTQRTFFFFFFCISLSWGWSCSLSPAQCHELPSIVHQALRLSDLAL